MRVLITNDDGWESPGIGVLAGVARDLGAAVVVAAPAWNSSGASASITGVSEHGRLVFEEHTRPDVADVTFVGVEAAPAMIVRAGVRGAFGPPPDLVLSGINDGPNTGHAILHSGTVGAALTAATHGCRSVAFSLGVEQPPNYEASAEVARRVIPWAVDAAAPLTLNVNTPSCASEKLRGMRRAALADFGAVQTNITERGEGHVELRYSEVETDSNDSDAGLLAAGWATITALRPVCEASDYDLSALLDDLLAENGVGEIR